MLGELMNDVIITKDWSRSKVNEKMIQFCMVEYLKIHFGVRR